MYRFMPVSVAILWVITIFGCSDSIHDNGERLQLNIYKDTINIDLKIKTIEYIYEKDTMNYDAALLLAKLYRDIGKFEVSNEHLLKIKRINGFEYIAHYYLAKNYQDLGKYALAFKSYDFIHDYNGFVFTQKLYEESYLNYISVNVEQIEYDKSVFYYNQDSLIKSYLDFQRLAANMYDLTSTYNYMGSIHLRIGSKENACSFYLKAKALGDSSAFENYIQYCKNK